MQRLILLILGLLPAIISAQVVSTGATIQLNGTYYFVSPVVQGKVYHGPSSALTSAQNAFGVVPVTVVDKEQNIDLDTLFNSWVTKDDVFQQGFLETVLIAGFEGKQPSTATYMSGQKSTVVALAENSNIPSGPYFLNIYTGMAYQAYRLYEDFAGAFTQSLLQHSDGQFSTLSAQIPASASITIGVPSRLYFTPTADKPLAGVRIAVKDIYSLAGVKNSCGNRAYYDLYPPATKTGTAMQNLIDAGAVIVGFQKASQFANGEVATADWVDYHAPFNPRGDGYQDAASSSAGAGSSMASYEWLDIAIGSDTGGSIRGPAGVQGLFGNRPSHGLVSLDNVMPLSPQMDTCGMLVRDPNLWDTASAALYKSNYTSLTKKEIEYPTSLYVVDFPTDDSPASQMQRKFAQNVAKFLNTSVSEIDQDRAWHNYGPGGAKQYTLEQFLNLTYTVLIAKDQTQLLRDPLYKDYAAAHDGRKPFIDPSALGRWDWADTQPESILTEAIHNKTTFMTWFNTDILPRSPINRTCSSGIMLHVDSTGSYTPRNVYRDPPALPFGYSPAVISCFAEVPDSVFPIGEAPYFSNITGKMEMLPVTVDIVVAKGCDGLITRLAKDLVAAGLVPLPKVGASLTSGGSILL